MDMHVLLAVAARAVIVYIFLFGVVRLLGKRKLGAHSLFDLLIAILLANLAGETITGRVTLPFGLFAAALVAGWHFLGYYSNYRSLRLQRVLEVEPTVMVRDGEVLTQALEDERITPDEFESLLRQAGVVQVEEVKLAFLEPSGRLSIVWQEWAREVRKADLQILQRGEV
ncbi:MAG: DUF421 domain-containing protein [Armatimonadota bacterium]